MLSLALASISGPHHLIIAKDLFFCLFVFRDRVSLYSPGCPGTHFVDQAGLELRNLPASASKKIIPTTHINGLVLHVDSIN